MFLSDQIEKPVLLPSKIKCLGCRTYFIQSEILHLEDISVEFKNYNDISNLNSNHQQIILKTIIAFLNTKGGTIYMGVEDNNCSVVGNIVAKLKQQEFRSYIRRLCQSIHPKINKKDNQVRIDYVPVLKKNRTFTGKYVTKIIIKQGETDTLYSTGEQKFVSQVCFQGIKKAVNVRLSFLRIGAGGVTRLQGDDLLQEVYRRAKDPNEIIKPHFGCHPQPQTGNIAIKTIGFRVQSQYLQPVASYVTKLFLSLQIHRQAQNYLGSKRLFTLSFKNSDQTQSVYYKIVQSQNNPSLKQLILVFLGIEDGMYIFQHRIKNNLQIDLFPRFDKYQQPTKQMNQLNQNKTKANEKQKQKYQQKKLSNNIKKQTNTCSYSQKQLKQEVDKSQYEFQQNERKRNKQFYSVNNQKYKEKEREIEKEKERERERERQKEREREKKQKVFYQFTHVMREKTSDLIQYLKNVLPFQGRFHAFFNSILVEVTISQVEIMKEFIKNTKGALNKYGFNGSIICGVANGHIFVEGFNYENKDQLKRDILNKYVEQNKINKFLIFPKTNTDIAYMDIWMQQKNAAHSLDILTRNSKRFQKYCERGVKKIKFLLQSDNQ